MCAGLSIQWPDSVLTMFGIQDALSSPSDSALQLDCLFSQSGLGRFVFTQVVSFTGPLLVVLIVVLYWVVYSRIQSRKRAKRLITTGGSAAARSSKAGAPSWRAQRRVRRLSQQGGGGALWDSSTATDNPMWHAKKKQQKQQQQQQKQRGEGANAGAGGRPAAKEGGQEQKQQQHTQDKVPVSRGTRLQSRIILSVLIISMVCHPYLVRRCMMLFHCVYMSDTLVVSQCPCAACGIVAPNPDSLVPRGLRSWRMGQWKRQPRFSLCRAWTRPVTATSTSSGCLCLACQCSSCMSLPYQRPCLWQCGVHNATRTLGTAKTPMASW